MEAHSHYCAELMYVEQGKCDIYIRGERIALRRGHYVLLWSNVTHRLFVDRDWNCRIVNLEFCPSEGRISVLSALSEAEISALSDDVGYAVLYDSTGEVGALSKQIVAELTPLETDSLTELSASALLLRLLCLMARGRTVENDNSQLVQRIQDYITKEYSGGIGARDVAAALNLNPIYIERVFKQSTGESLTESIIKLRLNNATKLMHGTTLPLVDIAIQCGFNSRQNFYAAFIKRYGKTPTEYRRQQVAADERLYKQAPFTRV